jgi:hypothetical protein
LASGNRWSSRCSWISLNRSITPGRGQLQAFVFVEPDALAGKAQVEFDLATGLAREAMRDIGARQEGTGGVSMSRE